MDKDNFDSAIELSPAVVNVSESDKKRFHLCYVFPTTESYTTTRYLSTEGADDILKSIFLNYARGIYMQAFEGPEFLKDIWADLDYLRGALEHGLTHEQFLLSLNLLVQDIILYILHPSLLIPHTTEERQTRYWNIESFDHKLWYREAACYERALGPGGMLYLSVRLPERSARVLAEAHQHSLQLDPYVTPWVVDTDVEQKGIEMMGDIGCDEEAPPQFEDENDLLLDNDEINTTAKHLCWSKFKELLQNIFVWDNIAAEAKTLVPPYVTYHPAADSKNKYAAGLILHRMFARYNNTETMCLVSGRIKPDQRKNLTLFRDSDRTTLFQLGISEVINSVAALRQDVTRSIYPLHNETVLKELQETWATYRHILSFAIPLNRLRIYFGEDITIFLALIMLAAHSLLIPGLAGLVLQAWCLIPFFERLSITPYFQLLYALLLIMWSSWFLQKWIRYESRLRTIWGITVEASSGVNRLDVNPSFEEDSSDRMARLRNRTVHDSFRKVVFMEPRFPRSERTLRICLTLTATILTTLCCWIILNPDLIHVLIWVSGSAKLDKNYEHVFNAAARFLAGKLKVNIHIGIYLIQIMSVFLSSLLTNIINLIWYKICVKYLTVYENHGLKSDFKNWVIIKCSIFQFGLYYGNLAYTGLLKDEFYPCPGGCRSLFGWHLTFLFSIHMLIHHMSILPWDFIIGKDVTLRDLPGSQREYYLKHWDVLTGTLFSYLQLNMTIGLVALFSHKIPILPLFAVFLLLIEARSRAIQLCTIYRRPYPVATGVMSWTTESLRLISFFCILTNSYLVAYGDLASGWQETNKILAFIVTATLGILSKDFVHVVYPPMGKKEAVMRGRMHEVLHDALWGPRDEVPEPESIDPYNEDLFEEFRIKKPVEAETSLNTTPSDIEDKKKNTTPSDIEDNKKNTTPSDIEDKKKNTTPSDIEDNNKKEESFERVVAV